MSLDDSLFGDVGSVFPPAQHRVTQAEIANWQVRQLRAALDALDLETMDARQRAVQDALGRPVASLLEVLPLEVSALLERLHASRATGTKPAGSTWDNRDEDTWIDRL